MSLFHVDLDENIKSFNIYTFKKFPTKIEHFIEWSNETFHQLFNENR